MTTPRLVTPETLAFRGAEKYGPKVRWLRQGLRMSGRQLCERVGITPSYLSDIETGRRLPAPEVSDRLADALAVDHDALWRLALIERLSDRDLRTLTAALPPDPRLDALLEAAREVMWSWQWTGSEVRGMKVFRLRPDVEPARGLTAMYAALAAFEETES